MATLNSKQISALKAKVAQLSAAGVGRETGLTPTVITGAIEGNKVWTRSYVKLVEYLAPKAAAVAAPTTASTSSIEAIPDTVLVILAQESLRTGKPCQQILVERFAKELGG